MPSKILNEYFIEKYYQELETRIQDLESRPNPADFGIGRGCKQVAGDWNTACINELGNNATGFFMGHNLANSPVANGGWFFVENLVHNSLYIKQIAYSFGNRVTYIRNKQNGTWTSWIKSGFIEIAKGREFETGKEVFGKIEYCRRIDCGALPNATAKQIDLGFDVMQNPIHDYEGCARRSSNGACKKLPYVNVTYLTHGVQVDIWETNKINITTKTDWSDFDTSYIDVFYTKN